jgi:sulfate adenylyltransferase subunit 1
MVIEQLEAKATSGANYSEFELELNALVRKHFPHWNAVDLQKLLK